MRTSSPHVSVRSSQRLLARIFSTARRASIPFVVVVVVATVTPASLATASSSPKSRLNIGSSLRVGEKLTSLSHVYSAQLRPNGMITIAKRGSTVWTSSRGSGLERVLSRASNGDVKIRTHRLAAHATTTAKEGAPSYLTMLNNGDLALVTKSGVPIWQGGLNAYLSSVSIAPYSRGALYGGSNPSVVCYTCEASNITGSAPPSNTLDSGTNVDNMTGDFSTSNTLFDAPALGVDLSLSLGYDAQLAQNEVAAGSGAVPFGTGWNSNFSSSISQGYNSSGVPTLTVDQGNGSQVTFTQSADGGTSTSCDSKYDPSTGQFPGDYPTTNKYTMSGSNYQFCALASVKGQISEVAGTGFTYQQSGGQSIEDFAWNGQLAEVTTAAASSGSPSAGLFVLYGVAGGSTTTTAGGVTLTRQCPSGVTCTIIYSSDARDIVEELNSSNQVTTVIDPSGATYALAYSGNNLISVAKPNGTGTPSTTSYVYTTLAGSPYTSDLTQIYDPNATVATPAVLNAGEAHSTTIAYTAAGSADPGMVSSIEDGTATATTYSYGQACATGQCLGTGDSQTTTVTYPLEAPCPTATTGCTPTVASPVETDQYTSGLETSTSLGSLTNANENETWSYAWNLGNGTANSSELITYPETLNVANNAGWQAPKATIIIDPSGNVVSTTNAAGDVATSAYNDVGANNLPELLWSFSGPSTNAPNSPPTGASVFTYNSFGQVLTTTDPVGAVTTYGYYGAFSELCYVAAPSLHATLGSPPSCTGTDTGASGAPTASTTYSYDGQGDVTTSTLDTSDTSANADTQTTTANFDVMGNQLWSIPATGQGGAQSSSNPFATSTSYSAANLPVTVSAPDSNTMTNVYDRAFNHVSTTTPAGVTTTAYDGDNRACYTVTAAAIVSGLTCSSAVQAGATATTYVPGSLATSSVTDANNNTTSYYYNDLAYPMAPSEVVDPSGSQKSFATYDDYGNACVTGSFMPTLGATQCSVLSGDTSTVYNALGAATQVTDPSGNATLNYYENASFPMALTRSTNALSKTTKYVFDADGRLLTTTNPDGTSVTTDYNLNGLVCNQEPTAALYPCGQGPSAAGVTINTYNNANQLIAMSDNTGNPATPSQWSQTTSYTYATGQLIATTDANNKTLSYLYNDAGQVACEAYPVSTSASCGTLSSPSTPSTSNTITTRGYDSAGRLTSSADWLGDSVAYTYADAASPNSVTKITYPSSTGLSANYTYDNAGNVTGLVAGSSITDAWTYNADEQVASTTINGSASGTVAYNANHQITAATNLGTATINDTYTLAANGEVTADATPASTTVSSTYNAGDQLCNAAATSTPCGSTPANGTNYAFTTNGQRSTATPYTSGTAGTPTHFAWNVYGELCNVASTSTACGSTPTSGTSYQYNGEGLRVSATTPTSRTDSTWNVVASGGVPLNVNDATTTSGITTNTSYLYGVPLFGGTAPIEQITGSTASFFVASPTGVQGVYDPAGTVLELAIYSTYGTQVISAGTDVTPFGFQGSYTDSTGLIYLINRYYDPSTDQFMSIDPAVSSTKQPYVFVNDDPLNLEDALGLSGTMLARGNVGFERPKSPVKVSASQTIKTIINALKSNPVIEGLDLSGAVVTGLAKQLSNDMYQNGGTTISSKSADALEGMAGIGAKMSGAAGAAGVLVNISNDLASGNSPMYATVDAVSQLSAGVAAGGWAAGACFESGPGALLCGMVGFAVGYMAASTTAIAYKFAFKGK